MISGFGPLAGSEVEMYAKCLIAEFLPPSSLGAVVRRRQYREHPEIRSDIGPQSQLRSSALNEARGLQQRT